MNNEQDIFIKLAEKAKTVKLTERERATLFFAVDTHVKNNKSKWLLPVRSPFVIKTSIRSFISAWHIQSLRTAVVFFALVILGAGGTSLAAQNSLPGDFFYPFRVNVNEEIRSVLLSGQARSEYEVARAKKRVEEARELVVQNKMSPEIRNKISARLNSHVSRVQKDIDDLTQKGELKTAFEISNNLEVSLAEGETFVSALSPDEVSSEELASINGIIRGPREASIATREKTESQILTMQVNDENIRIIAEAKFEAVKKIIQSIEDKILFGRKNLIDAETGEMETEAEVDFNVKVEITADTDTDADTETEPEAEVQGNLNFGQLKSVRELLKKGEEKLIGAEYEQAFVLFREAYELALAIQLELGLENNDIYNELDSVTLNLDSDDFNLNDDNIFEMNTELDAGKDVLIVP